MKDVYDIALAGLIHDIGKVMQRAAVPLKDSLKQQESLFCKWAKHFYSYRHTLFTVQFIENYLKEIVDEEYLKVAGKHHVPENELENIIAQADRLSAGMDRKNSIDEDSNNYNYKNTRLYSMFKNIDLGKGRCEKNFYHDLISLEVNENIFPKDETLITRKNNDSEREYYLLFDKIVEEIKEIDTSWNIESIYNQIYSILESYTTFVPSSTINYPDIGLFDHLKTTSAIAACIYQVGNLKGKNDDRFILLEGDISGIQSFIFDVTEGEKTKKNIAKSLRGRSAYINVLVDFLSKYIIKEMGVTISNILYCGGGKFQLLIPNTEEAVKNLSLIEENIQDYLYNNFHTKLGFVMGYIKLNDTGIYNYSDSITELQDVMIEEKNRKFLYLIKKNQGDFFLKENNQGKTCEYCNINIASENNMCDICKTQIRLGSELIDGRLKYIIYDFDNTNIASDIEIEFGTLGKVHFVKELNKNINVFLIENINGKGKFGRNKNIGNIVPTKDGVVASFNDIAKVSEGDNKIGLLKMDIDNLGTIFSDGLSDYSSNLTDKGRSISRISTLSRMIDLFFSGYINNICKDLYDKYKYLDSLENYFYINYAGGDDLLIIGPWDLTIELAIKIREDFSRFVCENKNITISAGVYITDSKTPIRMSAIEGESLLEKSKNIEGKDRITILDNPFEWHGENSLEKAYAEGKEYAEWLKKNYISRGLIYNLMLASKNIKTNENRIDYDMIPKIAYSVSRNVTNKDVTRKIFTEVISSNVEVGIEFVKYPLTIALLKTRGKREV
jgi:CRISPR-associated protein Csm1